MSVATDLAPTGELRASINLGNPVLAGGTPTEPTGVTVDLATEFARLLDIPVRFLCFDAARKSFAAMADGAADLCFLAVDPARAAEVAFTAPYVQIEGVYVVAQESPITELAQVDQPGVRVGVKEGSAYDLFLSRELANASVVRGENGSTVYVEEGLDVAAGIREPMTQFVAEYAGLRMLDEPFMRIPQAVGTSLSRSAETLRFLSETVERLKADGFVARALQRSGQSPSLVAPAQSR